MKKFFFVFISLFFLGSLVPRAQEPNVSLVQIISQIRLDSLMQNVEWLSGVDSVTIASTRYLIKTRYSGTDGNTKAGQYIKARLAAYGLTTSYTTFRTNGQNVLGVQTGTLYPTQKYVICAHYDDQPSGTLAPGADDNASGVAAVLEAARVLSQYDFPYTIVYALWDEEEQGLYGSADYAADASAAGDVIKGVVNMDMIAWEADNNNLVQVHTSSSGNSTDLSRFAPMMNTMLAIGLVIQTVNPGTPDSDHASFWDYNFKAIGITEDYDNDFNTYYHTTNDKVAYFDQPYFLKVTKLAISTFVAAIYNLQLSIEHTPIASMETSAPITTYARVVSGFTLGSGANAPALLYRTRAGGSATWSSFTRIGGILNDGVDQYRFTIPAIPLGTVVQYYIAAQDVDGLFVATSPEGGSGVNPPGSTPPATFHQFFVAHAEQVVFDPATNINRWVVSGGWNTTAAKFYSAPYSFNESPAGSYPNNATYTMQLKDTIDLTQDIFGASISFYAQWDIEEGYDYVQVQAKTLASATWTPLTGKFTTLGTGSFQPSGQPLYDGTQATWVSENFDLMQFDNQRIQIRFYFRSDGDVTGNGFFFDDFSVSYYSAGSPDPGSALTGTLSYRNSAATPLGSVKIRLKQGSVQVDSTVTAANGTFGWTDIVQGTYTLNAVPPVLWGGLTSTDALNVRRNIAGLLTFDALQLLAADVNNSTTVTSTDALLIRRRVVRLDPSFPRGDWAFQTPTVVKLNQAQVQNILGLCVGDVNASFVPAVLKETPPVQYLVEGEIALPKDQAVQYPVYMEAGQKIGAVTLVFDYDPALLSITGIESPMEGLLWNAQDGMLTVAWDDLQGMTVDPQKPLLKILVTGKTENSAARITVNELLSEIADVNASVLQGVIITSPSFTSALPEKFMLEQNFPNPFNPSTIIRFGLPENSIVKIGIYNVVGELVADITESEFNAGYHEVTWNAGSLPSSIYFIRINAQPISGNKNFTDVKKALLVK